MGWGLLSLQELQKQQRGSPGELWAGEGAERRGLKHWAQPLATLHPTGTATPPSLLTAIISLSHLL